MITFSISFTTRNGNGSNKKMRSAKVRPKQDRGAKQRMSTETCCKVRRFRTCLAKPRRENVNGTEYVQTNKAWRPLLLHSEARRAVLSHWNNNRQRV